MPGRARAPCDRSRPACIRSRRHRDDLALEARRARAHVALQGVLVREQAEGLVQERVVVAVAAVHGPGALAVLPDRVLLGGHLAQLAEDLLAGAAAVGELAVDAVALGVGIEVEEVAHGLLLLGVGRAVPPKLRV